jgi:hypothetical protein
MSHRQHQAGCPLTIQRGSGSSPRWRQRSSMSRFGTESLAHLDKSNRLMLRVLVRHGAPAPCSQSERRRLGAGASGYWIPVWWDANSCWLIQPRSGPQPAGRGRRETARRKEGTKPAGRPARSGPLGALGNQGTVRPLARPGYPNNFQATGPTRGPRGFRDTHTASVLAAPPPLSGSSRRS